MYPDAILGGRIFDAARPYYVLLDGYWWSDSGAEMASGELHGGNSRPNSAAVPTCALSQQRGLSNTSPRMGRSSAALMSGSVHSWATSISVSGRNVKGSSVWSYATRDFRQRVTSLPSIHRQSLARLQSTLLLARLHRIPCGMVAMVWRHSVARITEELDRVDYWAEYGTEIGWSRRTLWYLRGCFQAMRRERLRRALRQIFACARMAARPGARGSAR